MLLLPVHESFPCFICGEDLVKDGNILKCKNHVYWIHIKEYNNLQELNTQWNNRLKDLMYGKANGNLCRQGHPVRN